MSTEKIKDTKDKSGCTDLGSTPKDFQEMFERMSKCFKGQGGSFDCSAVMDRMMKNMTEMCCGPKADNAK
jgi:hypothetical protein